VISPHRVKLSFFGCAVLCLIAACATAPDTGDWIKVGETTREDVVKRYGQPDLIIASGQGELATYRPWNPDQMPPRVEIPTAQMGPAGMPTTKMQPVNRGPGSPNGGFQDRPAQGLQIRYDTHGIVQEIIR